MRVLIVLAALASLVSVVSAQGRITCSPDGYGGMTCIESPGVPCIDNMGNVKYC